MVEAVKSGSLKAFSGYLGAVQRTLFGGYASECSHYQKVIVVLKETIRLVAEIDELIPGWPVG